MLTYVWLNLSSQYVSYRLLQLKVKPISVSDVAYYENACVYVINKATRVLLCSHLFTIVIDHFFLCDLFKTIFLSKCVFVLASSLIRHLAGFELKLQF